MKALYTRKNKKQIFIIVSQRNSELTPQDEFSKGKSQEYVPEYSLHAH